MLPRTLASLGHVDDPWETCVPFPWLAPPPPGSSSPLLSEEEERCSAPAAPAEAGSGTSCVPEGELWRRSPAPPLWPQRGGDEGVWEGPTAAGPGGSKGRRRDLLQGQLSVSQMGVRVPLGVLRGTTGGT